MPILDLRELLAFPSGDNTTDSVISGVHFNLTTLNYWNYTLYSNGTLSNGSWCIVTVPPHTPKLLYPNGTFVNSTSCYTPMNGIGTRGKIGVGLATLFGAALLLQFSCLRKHGKLYLPVTRRFYPVGRRWQWYWGLWVCSMALISLFTNVDVDRYYVLELPIVLTNFFWFLMQWGALALVWEAARHWGSWLERQYIDPNPFELREDDRRAKVEFYLPLWFYFWLWLNFFLIVPRNWGLLELQRDPDQLELEARPMATDGRFKAAAFCLAVCFATICFSLFHSLVHYRHALPLSSPDLNSSLRRPPLRWLLLVPLAGIVVAYQALCSFDFDVSPLKARGNYAAAYAGGYAPSLAILLVQAVYGFAAPNEDHELLRQRRVRGQRADESLGIVHKPSWWRRVRDASDEFNHGGTGKGGGVKTMGSRIARNVRELGGGAATARGLDEGALAVRADEVELANVRRGASGGAPSSASPRKTSGLSTSQRVATYLHGEPEGVASSAPSRHTGRRWPGSLHPEADLDIQRRERESLTPKEVARARAWVERQSGGLFRPATPASPSSILQPPPPYSERASVGAAAEVRGRSTATAGAGVGGISGGSDGGGGRGGSAVDGLGQQLLNIPSRTPSMATTGDGLETAGTITPGSQRSRSTGTLVSEGVAGRGQQTIRSMLDV